MRGSLFHRLTACLVALCFALFSVEAAVADVHDADGSSSAGAAQAEGPQPPASPGTERHDLPGESGHPVHVCHCTHGHIAGSVADRVTVSFAPVHYSTPEIALARYAPSRTHQPLVRPPIA